MSSSRVVSTEWPFLPLGTMLQRPPRYGVNAAAVPAGTGDYAYIRITDIDNSGRFRPKPRVEVRAPNAASYVLQPGELVFARTGASVGKSYLYDKRDGELVYAGFLIKISPNPRVLNPKFLSLFAQTKPYWDWVTRTSARSGQPGINGREYAVLPVPSPKIDVQEAVACALWDVDELITTLERLIAKKQAIKQGMMQRLLTGETRLTGHKGDWVERRLASVIGKLEAGVSVNSVLGSGQYAVLKTSCVSRGGFDPSESKTVAPSDIARAKVNPQADSLIISRMNTRALVGEVGYVAADWPNLFLPDRLWLATKNHADPVDMRWLGYLLSSPHYCGRLKELATGTSGSMKNIARGSFLYLTMPFPPMDEQAAIARVLSDLDRELAQVRKRLTKARAVKQGMMQQLLTGRTRLPVKEAVS